MLNKNLLPLLGLPTLALLIGFLTYGPAQSPRFESLLMGLHVIASIALIFAWYWRDARDRRYKPSIFLSVVMLVLTMLALPYYLFCSRHLVGGLKSIGASLLIFIAIVALYRAGAVLAQ